ncbi:MAG: hypothetical protein DWQ07_03285 [Chloroflexi bacterium]|nr:MAG: hypothetical protein DWQ07_03285 [Chloroflexota bacterium]MBL1193476.1 hypothetical protein [Chloroflexota bacterium]
MSIAVNEAEDGDYNNAFFLAREAGLQTVSLSLQWDEIETAPGVYAPEPNFLEIANLYYPNQNIPLDLMIGAIDTNNLRLPDDLRDKSFDDPEVVERYKALLDYVFSQLPETEVNSLAVGNEINAWLGDDPGKWKEYTIFYEAIVKYMHANWPDVPVGSKVMYSAMAGDLEPLVTSLNTSSDIIMVTYYPLNEDFRVQDPEVVHRDFQTIADIYPDRTIWFMEIGYPSSTINKSSEEKQAQFIQQAFQAWDTHADHIQLLNFVWLTDIPADQVSVYEEYYGLSDAGFLAYLASLGLRYGEGSGSDKPAFLQLILEAEARGW